MARILTNLTIINLLSISVTFVVGFISWLRGGILKPDMNYPLHLYLGLFAVICNLGLHSLIFIYFLGTGRWVKEVALAYSIPDEPYPKQTRELKRRVFPPALFAMLVPIGTAAAGMAQFQNRSEGWTQMLHLSFAVITLLINLWAFREELFTVRENVKIIDGMMAEVNRIRTEKGLPTNEEAIKEQKQ